VIFWVMARVSCRCYRRFEGPYRLHLTKMCIMYKKTTAFYSATKTASINTRCGQNAELLNFKAGATYNFPRAPQLWGPTFIINGPGCGYKALLTPPGGRVASDCCRVTLHFSYFMSVSVLLLVLTKMARNWTTQFRFSTKQHLLFANTGDGFIIP
jgi:hypothetical protein